MLTDFVADKYKAVQEAAVGVRGVLQLTKPNLLSVLKAGSTTHIVDKQCS